MKQEFSKHWLGYLVLLLASGLFAFVFLEVWPDRNLERMAIIGYAIFYYLWGILTHRAKQPMTLGLIKEYGLVATLGAALLLMLTF